MIVVDSSALIAILLHEPEREAFLNALTHSTNIYMSWVSIVETHVVAMSKHPPIPAELVEKLIHLADVHPVEFNGLQAKNAWIAYERYGKGRHPAGLNFGDCFAYALAKEQNAPLLCKGDDFIKTDIEIYDVSGA